MEFIAILMGFIFLIFVIISLVYSSRLLLGNSDLSALHLFLVIILLDCWIFATTLILFERLLLLTSDVLRLIYYLSNIALYLGMIGFSSLMTRALFSRMIRILSKFSVIGYSAIVTLNLVDLLLTSPLFFVISQINGVWYINLHPLPFIFIFIVISLNIVSLSLAILNSPVRSENLFFRQLKDEDFLRIIVILMFGAGFILFFGIASLIAISLKTGLIVFVTITIILLTLLFYLSLRHPFFYLTTETQPRLLLEEGYIGYLLAAFTDYGPSPIIISEQFTERMNLSNEVFANFSISGLSSVAVYELLSYTFSLLPVPSSTEIVALTFTFLAPNPDLEDERIREGAPTFIGVMFPSNMLFGLYNIEKFAPDVWNQVRGKVLSQLADHDFLENLVLFILRKMLE